MKYFKLAELIRSDTAKRLKINNVPTDGETIRNLEALGNDILDPIREMWGAPIYINSGFRSKKLNKAVGGAATSQHVKGEAADIDTRQGQQANAKLFAMIQRSGLDFDQLINEDSDRDGNPNWVHISYKRLGGNRNQVLTLH